ncbi:CBS domain-containing protein [Acetobacteraceae bacterium KSS8]|uniref:CBS domain-containing protein n=1 Tax=Endosaccharibacter trunci TaxID=2812733 RepID=A0ABT1W5S1_9PROT|nr:CBS domain-containing protein [Acetobacteraceae bacterium KSS8]
MLIAQILEQKGPEVASLRPTHSVADAVALMADRRIGAVVIEDGDAIVGIFSERDLVKLLARDRHTALDSNLRKVMTAPVITCQAGDRIDQVIALMGNRHVRHMPVTDGKRMIGIVSIRDLVRARFAEKELENATLLDISRMHG